MSATLSEQLQAVSKAGAELNTEKILYMLFYRSGNNPYPQFTFFFHGSKDMKMISERAKRHCDAMSYRFVYVRPAIIDLDQAENFLLNRDM